MTLDDRPQQFETRDHYLALLERLDVPVEQALKAVGIDRSPSDAGGAMLDPETFYAFANPAILSLAESIYWVEVGRLRTRSDFSPRRVRRAGYTPRQVRRTCP